MAARHHAVAVMEMLRVPTGRELERSACGRVVRTISITSTRRTQLLVMMHGIHAAARALNVRNTSRSATLLARCGIYTTRLLCECHHGVQGSIPLAAGGVDDTTKVQYHKANEVLETVISRFQPGLGRLQRFKVSSRATQPLYNLGMNFGAPCLHCSRCMHCCAVQPAGTCWVPLKPRFVTRMMPHSALDLGTATSTMGGEVRVHFAKRETSPRGMATSSVATIWESFHSLRTKSITREPSSSPRKVLRDWESLPDAFIALQVVHASGAMPGKYVEGLFPRDGNRQ